MKFGRFVSPQITRVCPIETSTEPLACGATFSSKSNRRGGAALDERAGSHWLLAYGGVFNASLLDADAKALRLAVSLRLHG